MPVTTDYPAWAEQLNTPVTYPAQYLALAEARGLDTTTLLAAAGLDAAQLATPGARISLANFLRFLTALLATGSMDDMGMEVGLRLPLTAHGNLGYALICASHPREALDTLQQYWGLRGRGLRFGWTETDATLRFDFHGELVLPPALAQVLTEAMLVSFCQGVQFLLGTPVFPGEIGFVMPEPAHHGRYRERLPVLRYGQTENSVVILNKALFDKPLSTGNPEARQQALALCAREMSLWGDDAARQPLLARAQAEMALTGRGYPGPDELADRLHLSLRTLRRRLAAEGSGYQALLDAARARDALALLAQPELEIRQIARLLGYEDPANFTRAFRSRTGMTPSAARLSHAPRPSPAPATTD